MRDALAMPIDGIKRLADSHLVALDQGDRVAGAAQRERRGKAADPGAENRDGQRRHTPHRSRALIPDASPFGSTQHQDILLAQTVVDAPFAFVTDGLPSAIERARAIAGDRDVCVTPGKIASQCLELGLLDEISIDLVPVLLGSRVRFLDELKAAPILLDGPDLLVEGSRVTHLRYHVRRS